MKYFGFIILTGSENQEKSQKWCLGLGPIYVEMVFKTSFGKIQKIHPSKNNTQKPFFKKSI